LELTAALVKAYATSNDDLLAISRLKSNRVVTILKHGAPYLRPIVFQREIPVA
jgi:hypothetical protein